MGRRAIGPVEQATSAFVRGLGTLSARNAALAASAVRVARLLDTEERGSAAKSLASEHRQLLLALEPNRSNVPAPAPETTAARAAPPDPEPVRDPVEEARDELARRRALQAGRSA